MKFPKTKFCASGLLTQLSYKKNSHKNFKCKTPFFSCFLTLQKKRNKNKRTQLARGGRPTGPPTTPGARPSPPPVLCHRHPPLYGDREGEDLPHLQAPTCSLFPLYKKLPEAGRTLALSLHLLSAPPSPFSPSLLFFFCF